MRHEPSPQAKKYYDEGGALLEQSELDKAIACYTRAVEVDHDYGSAYFNRALAYAILTRYSEATEDAKTVLQLEPDCHDGPYLLGVICEYQRDYDRAADWYRESLKRNPDYTNAMERLRNLEGKMKPRAQLEEIFADSPDPEAPARRARDWTGLDEDEPEAHRVGRTVIVDGEIKGLALKRPKKKMEDVIGLEDVKKELKLTVIGPAKNPEALKRWNLEAGLSVLLYGPSGCGKTHLVEAVAGELGAYILNFNLNEVIDMYSGNTEKNIHAIFQQARDLVTKGKASHVVIFIDELDALGMNRAIDRDMSGRRSAINQLLMELDGVERNPEGMIIVGATNRPWDIDPALMRAGRFGDEWYVAIPSTKEREKLFELYLKGVPTDDIDFLKLARETRTYSPADIKRVVRKAKLRALEREEASRKESVLTTNDIVEVIGSNQASSLRNWFHMTSREFSSRRLDRVRYKHMIDDMASILGRKARLNQTGKKSTSSSSKTHEKPSIPAYA